MTCPKFQTVFPNFNCQSVTVTDENSEYIENSRKTYKANCSLLHRQMCINIGTLCSILQASSY